MNRRYAENTRVPESKSRTDIEALLAKYECQSIATMQSADSVWFCFVKGNRSYRIGVPLPAPGEDNQERRRRLRTLFAYIKGRLIAVADGLMTFEEEFQPEMVYPDGLTVREHATRHIAELEASGETPTRPMLPGPSN